MLVCRSCGRENPPGFRFCGGCGAPLGAEGPAGVRKTVTVLFCDLVGSTAMGDHSDPELLREAMGRYHAMAVFGIPQVHEDDALRAVRAADEIRGAVGRLQLQVRIGVNGRQLPQLRAHSRRRHQVLGPERQRPARRWNGRQPPDAGFRHWLRSGEGGARNRLAVGDGDAHANRGGQVALQLSGPLPGDKHPHLSAP